MYIENGEKRSRDIYIARNVYPQVHDTAFIDSGRKAEFHIHILQ